MLLVVMQGASGSGKSTLAKVLASVLDAVIHSTDDLMLEAEVYNFRPELLGKRHKENLDNAVKSMNEGKNVIIDNTNTQRWEAREYVRAAVSRGYVVKFVRCEGRYQNLHGVPEDRVEAMRARMEDLSVEGCLNAKAPWEK